MPVGWTRCLFCGKKIWSIFSQHHQKVCRVKRGLDKREPLVELPENSKQQTFDKILMVKFKNENN